jgi:hypothetical protein
MPVKRISRTYRSGSATKDERRFTKGRQHQLIEQFSIEKPWVRLTRSGSIPRLLGVARNGDVLPHLKTYLKVFGDLAQITPELIRGRCWQ